VSSPSLIALRESFFIAVSLRCFDGASIWEQIEKINHPLILH